MIKKILILALLLSVTIITTTAYACIPTPEEEFQAWADTHQIILQGTKQNQSFHYTNGWNATRDAIDWKTVPNHMNVYTGLKSIPDSVLAVAKGQTMYISSKSGNSYTVLGSWCSYPILCGMNKGSILEQPIPVRTVTHEMGHIVDFNGIQCTYGCSQSNFFSMKTLRMSTFALPQTTVSTYAGTNTNENFAESFTYFVNEANLFRSKIVTDPTLAPEYNFMKTLFGKEY